ncbi:MAG TPA: hypothetical protein VMJ34_22725 [Bryobacteraceae bacterium]|nr:hypothetical protein [Bryobacteraceae bacterium]
MKAILTGLALTILAIPSACFAWRCREMPQLGAWHDDAIYWISARSLATGHGYTIAHLPTQPPQTKYPPLYPALMALLPDNLAAATLFQWTFAPLFLVLAWFWFRRCTFGPASSWGLTLLLAAAPMTTLFAVSLMTELPFTVALLGLILLMEDRDVSTGRAALAGALAVAAFLLRTNAIVLVFAVPALLAYRRRFRQALAFAAPLVAAIAGWQGWCAVHRFPARDDITAYYTSYTAFYLRTFSWTEFPHRVWTNADAIIESLAKLVLFYTSEGPWLRAVSWVITAAAVAGVVALFRRGIRYYPLFGALFAAVLLLWQYPPDQRFVYPLFPLYVAGLATRLTEVASLGVRSWKTATGANRIAAIPVLAAIAALVAGSLWSTTESTVVLLPDYFAGRRSELSRLTPVWRWIAAATPSDARFVSCDDTLLFLHTGRRSYSQPILPSVVYGSRPIPDYIAGLPALWRSLGVTHVLLTDYDFQRDLHAAGHDALARLLSDPRRFRLVYTDQAARVYTLPSENEPH